MLLNMMFLTVQAIVSSSALPGIPLKLSGHFSGAVKKKLGTLQSAPLLYHSKPFFFSWYFYHLCLKQNEKQTHNKHEVRAHEKSVR